MNEVSSLNSRVCPSKLLKGQVDFTNWLEFIADRFALTYVGLCFSVWLFDGPRFYLSIPVLLILEITRWRSSPYFQLSAELFARSPFEEEARNEIREIWLQYPLRAWWWLALPILPAATFSALVLALDEKPVLAILSAVVEPLSNFFNGAALREDLRYANARPPHANIMVISTLLWALACWAVSTLILLRGWMPQMGSLENKWLKPIIYRNEQDFKDLSQRMEDYPKKFVTLFFLVLIIVLSHASVSNVPDDTSIFHKQTLYFFVSILSTIILANLIQIINAIQSTYKIIYSMEKERI